MTIENLAHAATITGFFVAIVAILLNAWSLWQHAKASDVATYLRFVSESADLERRFCEAMASGNEELRRSTVVEQLNYLDALARVYLRGAVGANTSELYRETLLTYLSAYQSSGEIVTLLENAVTHESAFDHLKRFYGRDKKEIQKRAKEFECWLLANRVGAL